MYINVLQRIPEDKSQCIKKIHIYMDVGAVKVARVPSSCIDDNRSGVSHGTSNDFSLDSIQIGPCMYVREKLN